jgi:2-keto-4-pentenoate hydratase/2-oxohepta-3-ene-1,7-dioic acid hydratase in catechol pathway
MRFVTYRKSGSQRVGIVDGDTIVDSAAIDPGAPRTMKQLITDGVPARLADKLASADDTARIPIAEAELLIPLPDAGKLICVGLNYHDHAVETGQTVPPYPAIFMRALTSLVAAGEPMIVPRVSQQLDFEAELVIVVGRRARHVGEAEALSHVFGYTCLNEGTVRDYQNISSQWTIAKNFDRTAPIGPWITTADDLPPGADGLSIRTLVNGAVMQDASTSNMIFSVARIVSLLSEAMTLEPGDLISTGTPAGVGVGRNPPVWLKPGDTVTVEIEGVGVLSNPVASER